MYDILWIPMGGSSIFTNDIKCYDVYTLYMIKGEYRWVGVRYLRMISSVMMYIIYVWYRVNTDGWEFDKYEWYQIIGIHLHQAAHTRAVGEDTS